ncbi:hypothetical protein GPA19_15725 [Azoarcus indigens]|uniref:Uncharacterized protein n=1 Tax=Azoarcus indigens TaxID=29545 RepID=A0A4R6DKX1_9RHOO|nr:hypothetical protein [Azoarcus indigens]NMG66393.1 hypothetical protein [Azoarcus indigens]TDN45074.1 hypothetical protein C7389_13144 [Azoarcus indigens]
MYSQHRNAFYERLSRPQGGPPSLLQKIVAVLSTLALFAVSLMFSVVFFAIVLTLGAVAWGYLWWKTRAVRRQMRERAAAGAGAGGTQRGRGPAGGAGGGMVIEGEVIREVREDERR